MVKESPRKCSSQSPRSFHGNGGVISGKCFKLFGVNIMSGSDHPQSVDQSLKKSVSMCNLEPDDAEDHHHLHETGYLSDGVIHHRKGKAAHERKKGKPWTKAEHMTFLAGLEKLGKGDWRGISKKFVPTRTPTQVASHAQKYFLRQAATDKKKRRSSLFDMPLNKEHGSASQDLSIGSSSKNPVTSSEASSSNALALKHSVEMPVQVISPCQIANRFPALCLDSPAVLPMAAATGVPSYHGIPYMSMMVFTASYDLLDIVNPMVNGDPRIPQMSVFAIYRSLTQTKVGVAGNGQRYTTALSRVSLVSVMTHPRTGYLYMPKSHGSLGPSPHINAHPSGIPSPRAVSHEPFQAVPLAEKDGLDLKISQPQQENVSTQGSGAISVT